MTKIKAKKINISNEAYEALLIDLNDTILKHDEIMKDIGNYISDNPIREDHVDSVLSQKRMFAEAKRREIREKEAYLSVVSFVEQVKKLDTVQLGDMIRVNLSYNGVLEEENKIMELTANYQSSIDLMFEQVSQNSEFGEVLLGKKIGSKVSYITKESKEKCDIEILEKINGIKNGPKQKVLAK